MCSVNARIVAELQLGQRTQWRWYFMSAPGSSQLCAGAAEWQTGVLLLSDVQRERHTCCGWGSSGITPVMPVAQVLGVTPQSACAVAVIAVERA
mmetsp:Transcript_72161/g.200155  ORF Transcript_72161/g.200155 Transcript_72161/m.200155 type:complete len:94 (+) Transcript_72161:364-645(+)